MIVLPSHTREGDLERRYSVWKKKFGSGKGKVATKDRKKEKVKQLQRYTQGLKCLPKRVFLHFVERREGGQTYGQEIM